MANIGTTRRSGTPAWSLTTNCPSPKRAYDVVITEGLLKSLLALGCKIEVPPALPDAPASIASPSAVAEPAAPPVEKSDPPGSDRNAQSAGSPDQGLRWCREIIEPQYVVCDRDALRHQRFHRYLTLIAGVAGTLAVLMAIFRLSKLGPGTWPAELEFGAAAIAFLAVCAGLLAKSQRRWLLQRHKAEQLQMLKFQFLISPALGRRRRKRPKPCAVDCGTRSIGYRTRPSTIWSRGWWTVPATPSQDASLYQRTCRRQSSSITSANAWGRNLHIQRPEHTATRSLNGQLCCLAPASFSSACWPRLGISFTRP